MDYALDGETDETVINCDLNIELNKRKLPQLSVDIDDSLPYKVQKLDDKMEYFTTVINDWISEYKKWSADSLQNDISKIESTINKFTKQHEMSYIFDGNYSQEYVSKCMDTLHTSTTDNILQSLPDYNAEYHLPYSDYPTNGYYFQPLPHYPLPLINNNNRISKIKLKVNGYWGPLLRYGTYGIFRIYESNVVLVKRNVPGMTQQHDSDVPLKETLKHPLELPLRIKIPRQAMICTLQSHAKIKINQLRQLEKDPFLHMTINYSSVLEQLTNQCGTCPKYLFTKVSSIPEIEREYFTALIPKKSATAFLSLDCSQHIEIKPIQEFYACELLIGDIIISQGFALWKRRALETCARKAFKVLEQRCCLIGSTRYWCNTDFLTACITEDLHTVTLLPPFLTDPTEPLYKKDEKINKSDPEENFDILNPKSLTDFWLFAPTLLDKGTIKDIDPQLLLYQSADFSQMNISFEIDTCFDESYTCTVLIDKSAAVSVEGLGSLEQARQAASLVLVDKLIDTQPIVVIKKEFHDEYTAILRNHSFRNNSFFVHSLMWSPNDVNNYIALENLSDHIESDCFISADQIGDISSRGVVNDQSNLRKLFNLYAQSSIVRPVKIDLVNIRSDIWPFITDAARLSGLLVLWNSADESVLICKQVPHRHMKAMLYGKKEFGVFSLLCDGDLCGDYLSDLKAYGCEDGSEEDNVIDKTTMDDDDDEPQHRDKHSPFRDIINDIPRELIPGLDF